jgi:hypothetical protein
MDRPCITWGPLEKIFIGAIVTSCEDEVRITMPEGETAANRSDVELLYDGLPEPVDLDIDPGARMLYRTDRGDPPRGNTVNRAPLDVSAGKRGAPEIGFDHLMEGIGLALEPRGGRMFVTDLGGSIYSANLDGTNRQTLQIALGNLSGIAYVDVAATSGGASAAAPQKRTPAQNDSCGTRISKTRQ